MLYCQGQHFPQPLGSSDGGCLTVSHTGLVHTDKKVLGAESQPQHQLPRLRLHRGWREVDSPACGAGMLP